MSSYFWFYVSVNEQNNKTPTTLWDKSERSEYYYRKWVGEKPWSNSLFACWEIGDGKEWCSVWLNTVFSRISPNYKDHDDLGWKKSDTQRLWCTYVSSYCGRIIERVLRIRFRVCWGGWSWELRGAISVTSNITYKFWLFHLFLLWCLNSSNNESIKFNFYN